VARLRSRNRGRKRVRFGKPDVSLTRSAGVAALAELVVWLGVVDALDEDVGAIKQRDRGITAGQLLVALAQCQLLGGHGLVALDHQRPDAAWQLLSAGPGVPSTTAASLAKRFGPQQLAGVESATARLLASALPMMPPAKRAAFRMADPTIDMDSTDVEVYGPGKQGVAFNYNGQRAGRPHLATWAEAGIAVAAELLAGNDDVRPRAADMLGRALAAIPAEVTGRPRVRADAGYFTADLAHAADQAGCDYAIAASAAPRCGVPMARSASTSESTPPTCPARRSPPATTSPRAGRTTRTPSCAGSASTPATARSTRARGGGAPSRPSS